MKKATEAQGEVKLNGMNTTGQILTSSKLEKKDIDMKFFRM